jgi:hypothetical protein
MKAHWGAATEPVVLKQIEASGWLHAPAIFSLEKETFQLIIYNAKWAQNRSGCLGNERKVLPPPRIEPRILAGQSTA